MLASGLPATSWMVIVPAVAVYLSARPPTFTLWWVETVRSPTGAPVQALAASLARSSLCRSSTLLPLSPPPPEEDCASAGVTARAAAAQKSVKKRIGRGSLGLIWEWTPHPFQKLVSR